MEVLSILFWLIIGGGYILYKAFTEELEATIFCIMSIIVWVAMIGGMYLFTGWFPEFLEEKGVIEEPFPLQALNCFILLIILVICACRSWYNNNILPDEMRNEESRDMFEKKMKKLEDDKLLESETAEFIGFDPYKIEKRMSIEPEIAKKYRKLYLAERFLDNDDARPPLYSKYPELRNPQYIKYRNIVRSY